MKCAIIISGISGSGKSSVAYKLIEKHPDLYSLSRSATSRARRENDKGKDEYLFMSREEFQTLIENKDMVESTEYSGNLYGTPKSELERIIFEGKCPVLVLEFNGVKSFKTANLPFPVFSFYVYENINVIEQRLYDRDLKNNPTEENLVTFRKRKQDNINDYLDAPMRVGYYDAYIKNSSLDACVSAIEYCLAALSGRERGDAPFEAALAETEKKAVADSLANQAREKAQ